MKQLFSLLLLSSMVLANIELPDSFTSDFTQLITNTKKNVIKYTGKVRFTNERLFKWTYLEPTKKEVCTDGYELLIVDHDLEQVSAYYIDKGLNISKVLQKAKHYRDDIYLTDYEDKKYTIQLDEKQQLQSIAYFDELDNKVQIVFENIKYTKGKLDMQTMKCNYPSSYDMIRD